MNRRRIGHCKLVAQAPKAILQAAENRLMVGQLWFQVPPGMFAATCPT